MPELPEVEAVKNGLMQLIQGKQIRKVTVKWDNLIVGDVSDFESCLVGEQIEEIKRRGKFLIFTLTHYDLISHLRMEGKYEYYPDVVIESKHCHIYFTFTDGSTLVYHDVRKFGRLQLVKKGSALYQENLKKLGVEPLSAAFSATLLQQGLLKASGMIKPVLLNQQIVVGLGNIYVDESLWQAKVHPKRFAKTLTAAEIYAIHQAIIDVLTLAVKLGGSTIRTYKNALGEAGAFQQQLMVYGKSGLPCHRCGTKIEKIKLAGRGTHFCPTCQIEDKQDNRIFQVFKLDGEV
ncbi:MAG: DNA-formamidopyrimidine glycosylase [Streptococcaceae bacterium]|jgi:formamidopyrimidine-DNA glycosylase|nr:DNA-formamidopyrimidine glycosylase [Streptococcaceae bacterium]